MKPDQAYGEAALEALGRNFAIVFKAMVAEGMTREEALEVIREWVRATSQPRPPE